MPFTDKYFNRFGYAGEYITDSIPNKLGITVVIPCFDEPYLPNTINSLLSAKKPDCDVEIIVVINAPEKATQEQLNQNNITSKYLNSVTCPDGFFVRKIIHPTQPKKTAGVGSARKAGMDEAVRRFGIIDNKEGVIVSLDADCLVATDYFLKIENYFKKHQKSLGCSIGFEHIIDEENLSLAEQKAISQYELYLRYYYHSLKHIGFPNPFYAIGSAFAVTVNGYMSQGGMNRRQAGEDFYFIQKLVHAGEFGEIKKPLVFPSARESNRVPFGTGTVVRDLVNTNADYYTYSTHSFDKLKDFFKIVKQLWETETVDFSDLLINNRINSAMIDFLNAEEYIKNIIEIKNNSSSYNNFEKRFFKWFDGLKILKFLNYSSENEYPKVTIDVAAKTLLEKNNLFPKAKQNVSELLKIFRDFDNS